MSPISLSKGLALVFMTLAIAACGRTDLELGGTGGSRVDSGHDGPRDASADLGATGGVAATGGRAVATGGRSGTGGRAATGGATGGSGRGGTGGRGATGGTGGRIASGGSGGISDGGVRDASVDAPGPDLPPSTPGTLLCGTQACDVKTQTCCVSLAVGSVGARCIPVGTACPGAALVCDEPADCPGAVCCFGVQTGDTGGLGVGSQCAARSACTGFGRFIVCRTNADCGGTMPACCSVGGVPVCQTACLGS